MLVAVYVLVTQGVQEGKRRIECKSLIHCSSCKNLMASAADTKASCPRLHLRTQVRLPEEYGYMILQSDRLSNGQEYR